MRRHKKKSLAALLTVVYLTGTFGSVSLPPSYGKVAMKPISDYHNAFIVACPLWHGTEAFSFIYSRNLALVFCACAGRCVFFPRRENGTGLVPCGRCVRPACGGRPRLRRVSFSSSFFKTFLKRIIFCFYLLFSCVFVTSSAVGRACHSAWRARARGACAAGGLFDLPRCAAPCVRPSGNYCRLRWPGGRAGRAKLNCGTQKFLQFFWCQATEQQNNTT